MSLTEYGEEEKETRFHCSQEEFQVFSMISRCPLFCKLRETLSRTEHYKKYLNEEYKQE